MPLFKRYKSFKSPAISKERKTELLRFEKSIGTKFKDHALLNLAFCHRSYANEIELTTDNNEKLEFLGDAILGMVVSEFLYNKLTDKTEGDLAKIKSFVVSEHILAEVARKINIDHYVLIGKGEESTGGRSKKAIIADTLEAIIGAYYLDSGIKPAREFVLSMIEPKINRVLENKHRKDYKTLLQEYVQKRFKTYPRYRVVNKDGPDHNKTFFMEVLINKKSYGRGKGKNKKEAEQNAAQMAYKTFKKGRRPTRSQVRKSASKPRSSSS